MQYTRFNYETNTHELISLTEEEIQILQSSIPLISSFPVLTSRQFWLAAASINIDENEIIAAINSSDSDSIERKLLIVEVQKSTTFQRDSDTVIRITELMEIPSNQVDDLWNWAATL